MINHISLNYNDLRKINVIAARQVICEVFEQTKNITQTASTLNTTRKTVRKSLKKKVSGNLEDKSKAPTVVHNKTCLDTENLVIDIKNKTNFGPRNIHFELLDHHNINISKHTIRNILRRNRKLIKRKTNYVRRKEKREFVDWYSAKPFEIVQIDLKYIIDKKALSQEQIDHIFTFDLPMFQWSAIDVNSRFKLIGYSKERNWTNGLVWYLWVTSWLRKNGVDCRIVYTVDNGEEFGGRSWMKINELNKILSGFGCKVIQNHKGHCEENAHVERSHRTDDDEFYIPKILNCKNTQSFYNEAFQYIYYYNNLRRHSALRDKRPFEYLKEQLPNICDSIRYVQPVILDKISANLLPWGGYHVLAQNQAPTQDRR
jgi:transposase InsO family protein